MPRIDSVHVESFQRRFVTPFRNAKVRRDTSEYILVAVSCEGETGWGEMTALPGYSSETIQSMAEAIVTHLGPAIHGGDPMADEEIAAVLRDTLPGNPYARSAVELALWDLKGRMLSAPVHQLIGGCVHRSIPIGAIVALGEPSVMAENAASWAAKGAKTFQVKISGDAASSCERVRAVREAVGSDAVIAVDGNGSFSRAEALRTMEALAPSNVAFFEQPVAIWDLNGMAELVHARIVPVVADECLVTIHDAMALVRRGAADGFNLKLAKSGISETRKIMAIADAAGIPYGLGSMLETHFGTLAGIHMASTIRKPLFSAELVGPWMVKDRQLGAIPQAIPGDFCWQVPDGAGWGGRPSEVSAEEI